MDGSDDGRTMGPLESHEDEHHEKKSDAVEESNLKPLKKAHYLWQIKGNYHLKNSIQTSETRESSLSEASSSTHQGQINGGMILDVNEANTQVDCAPTLCEHHPSQRGGRDSLLKSTNEYPALSPVQMSATTVSCVVCDTFNENVKKASLSVEEERSRTPPVPLSHADWNVRKWQTRQLAKAFMDNTINCVLEEMGFTPVPESAPDSDPDDVLGSINFYQVTDNTSEEEEEDESVENEGILSAIQRHGLQRHTLQSLPEAGCRFSSCSPTRCSKSPPRIWGPNQQIYRPMFRDEAPSSPDSLSVGSDFGVSAEEQTLSPADIEEDDDSSMNSSEDDTDEMHYNYAPPSSCRCAYLSLSKSKEVGLSSTDSNNCIGTSKSEDEESNELERSGVTSVISEKCSSRLVELDDDISKKRQGRNNVSSSISKRRCVEPNEFSSYCSASSSQSSQLSTSPDAVAILSHSNEQNSPLFGDFDFMDAAVAAAIQKKGLSSLTCQNL